MVSSGRASWLDPVGKRDAGVGSEAWIWFRSAEDWAAAMAAWVDGTGQRNTVLTFYELLEGDNTIGESFHGLPREMAQLSVSVLVRRQKASLLGEGDGMGVKFY